MSRRVIGRRSLLQQQIYRITFELTYVACLDMCVLFLANNTDTFRLRFRMYSPSETRTASQIGCCCSG